MGAAYKNILEDMSAKAVEMKTVKDFVLKAVVKHAADNDAANGPKFPLRPSSALKSMRDLYYSLCNYYKPGSIPRDGMDGRVHMLLDLGHSIEGNLVRHIEKSFEVPFKNVRMEYGRLIDSKDQTEIVLTGELDFVIKHPRTGELIICDSKSAGKYGYNAEKIKEDHIAQINLYLHSNWAKEKGITKAWVWYYSKEDSDFRVMEFSYSAALATHILSRFQHVHDSFRSGQLPPREYVYGVHWQAKYSDFRTYDNEEFSLSTDRREIVESDDELENLYISNVKNELIIYVAVRHGNKVVLLRNGKRLWLSKGLNGLLIKEGN